MKKSFFISLALLVSSIIGYAQEKYVATSESGLFLRNEAKLNASIKGKIYFGAEVIVLEKTTKKQSIVDDHKEIKGSWVKIECSNYPKIIVEGAGSINSTGYVFDGYLKKKSEFLKEIENRISNYPDLTNYTIDKSKTPFYLTGDFFGNGNKDFVILLKNTAGATKVAIINKGKNKVHFLGKEDDPFKMQDYNWIGVFDRVDKGKALWSNYEGDFLEFKDIPDGKKVRLSYNALYMHAAESCGGGFVYWKDGKFNWLQQE